jgi:hypothetical protein
LNPEHGAGSPPRLERRPPTLVTVAGELEIVALAGHGNNDAPDPEPAAEEGAEAGDDGRGASRGVTPGAGGQHREEEAMATRAVIGNYYAAGPIKGSQLLRVFGRYFLPGALYVTLFFVA